MVRVAIKYCGSCNPQVNLGRIASYLSQVPARRGLELVSLSAANIDVVVILCGCPRACGNKEEVRTRAKHHLVIAGESLAGRPLAETDLIIALKEELGRLARA